MRIEGSTVFTSAELAEIAAPYQNRRLSIYDLGALRDEITRRYVARGYVGPGALIPEQVSPDGEVIVRIVEGRLGNLVVVPTEGAPPLRLRPSYYRDRIALGLGDRPLNVNELRSVLLLLQRDPHIERLDADLRPGVALGESELRLGVEEAAPLGLGMEAANDRSPLIGSEQGRSWISHDNLTGFGDSISLLYGLADGIQEWELEYSLPITARDTTLSIRAQQASTELVEGGLGFLDASNEFERVGAAIIHPVHRTLSSELRLGLQLERTRSETTSLYVVPAFQTAFVEDQESVLSVGRAPVEWVYRTTEQVLAVRSTLGLGLDILGARDPDGTGADGRFLTWLGQLQWVRRIPVARLAPLLFVRGDLQLASDALPGLERFGVGGMYTVRGYRQDALVRDAGFAGSVELRVPVLPLIFGEDGLAVVPFFDLGKGWNHDHPVLQRTLAGTGIGLRYRIGPLAAEVFYGSALRDSPSEGDDLQDHGIHFRVGWDARADTHGGLRFSR